MIRLSESTLSFFYIDFFFKKLLFIFDCTRSLLLWCGHFSLVAVGRGSSLVTVSGLLIVVASLVEQGL